MRQKIAAGNWKMNLDSQEARELVTHISSMTIPKQVKVILACPALYLDTANTLAKKNMSVHLAAQNIHHESKGAFTGEISHKMLSSIGVNHALVGHSERREYFGEKSSFLKAKVNTLVANNFNVIFCCGEPLKIRKAKKHKAYVAKQLKDSLYQLKVSDLKQIVIAYEPIWAIGTGITASPAQAQEMHKFIRQELGKKYGKKTAQSVSILYGGSVKPANAKQLFAKPDVDGGLVGGASLKGESFCKIIKSF